MSKVTIDEREINVEPGTTILQAAEKLEGIEIPHYCYHPALSIAGACRMCLVEVEKMPKLQISCNTTVTDGMVVHTYAKSQRVRDAVRGVLEFTLINHPLDCPVCDQAGECGLQDYYMKYGLYSSRFYDAKVKKTKKAFPIGPYVVLDQERCILCSRCVRFCNEITKTGELGMFNRGDHSLIDIYPGKWLDNKYSGNVNDICPVGALTDRDFRFECRVWYLQEVESICPGCSNGCNIKVHYNINKFRRHIAGGRRVLRLKPRFNEFVNDWWLCDEGRYGYKSIDENRIPHPLERNGHEFKKAEWSATLDNVAAALKEAITQHTAESIAILASPQLTNEELYLIRKLFKENWHIKNLAFKVPAPPGATQDDFLIKADKNPNTRGGEALGLSADDEGITVEAILNAAAQGRFKVLYIFHHDLTKAYSEELLRAVRENTPVIVFQGSNYNQTTGYADLVLPSASYVEKYGTFTNFAGRVQKINKAFEPFEESQPDWKILIRLAERMGIDWYRYRREEDLFNEMAQQVPGFLGMSYARLEPKGLELNVEKQLA